MMATTARTPPPETDTSPQAEREFVAAVLRAECVAIERMAESLGDELRSAIDLLDSCAGHVAVTGMGKSGLIAQKISATLSSVGVPSQFIHPAEALHGDLGRVREGDVVWALSYSGNTDEVVQLGHVFQREGFPILAVSSNPASRLARLARVHLNLGDIPEACPYNLAPTASTTAMLALGDALALAVSRRRQFSEADFRRRHPGGMLGVLLQPITEVLRFRAGENLPLIPVGLTVREALKQADVGRRPGAMLIVDDRGGLAGLFTDGDLRRLVLANSAAVDEPIAKVMTRRPRVLRENQIVRDAVALVQEFRPDEIPVVDEQGRPVGLVDVQDLIALRIIQE